MVVSNQAPRPAHGNLGERCYGWRCGEVASSADGYVEAESEIPLTMCTSICGKMAVAGQQLRISRFVLFRLALACLLSLPTHAQFYAGVLGGVSSLSGDARSLVAANSSAFSSYDPTNGGMVQAILGKHLSDYFSVQTNYTWNSNDLTLASGAFNNGTETGLQETRSSSQQSVIGDFLVYFRNRASVLRPYLAVGTGLVHLTSSQGHLEAIVGDPSLPPKHFSRNVIALHVPVGIDVRLGKGWAFRYTFSETLTANPINDHLSPAPQDALKNFQNLFGFVKRF